MPPYWTTRQHYVIAYYMLHNVICMATPNDETLCPYRNPNSYMELTITDNPDHLLHVLDMSNAAVQAVAVMREAIALPCGYTGHIIETFILSFLLCLYNCQKML